MEQRAPRTAADPDALHLSVLQTEVRGRGPSGVGPERDSTGIPANRPPSRASKMNGRSTVLEGAMSIPLPAPGAWSSRRGVRTGAAVGGVLALLASFAVAEDAPRAPMDGSPLRECRFSDGQATCG